MREYIENYKIVKRSKLPKMGQKVNNSIVIGVNMIPLVFLPENLPDDYIYYKVCFVDDNNTYVIDSQYFYFLYAVKKTDFKPILNKLN